MSHDNHMRDRDDPPRGFPQGQSLGWTDGFSAASPMEYVPKHMKIYDDGFDHCCFAGCRRMDEYGCCANMGWHKSGCPLNPFREYDEQDHAFYVSQGLRKHLAPEPIVHNVHSACPRCGCSLMVAKRVCFGSDPHVTYRCTECTWKGRI